MAIISICHRISGVLLFLLLPLAIYLLHQTLVSAEGFAAAVNLLQHGGMKCLIWLMLSATFFHLVAGIRHLMMDVGIAESVAAGRISAYSVFALAIVLSLLAGVWLW
jgi:succinate dehydrogenase / fumarate reductase cytochrome b subunit